MLREYRIGQPHLGAAALLFGGFFTSCLFGESMSGATNFGDSLDFRCLFHFLPFSLLAGGKGNGFCWVSLFSLPFLLLAGGKGIGFRGFPRFSLPFSLLAGGKGNGFCWVSLFSLPFPASQAEKGIGFWEFPRFSLPFLLLAGGKSNGFYWVSLFSLPFGIIQNATYPMSPSP